MFLLLKLAGEVCSFKVCVGLLFFFFKGFIYSFMKDTEREAKT